MNRRLDRQLNRRRFLSTVAGVGVAAATPWNMLRSQDDERTRPHPRLDAHVHVNSPHLVSLLKEKIQSGRLPAVDADELIRRMDRDDVQQAVVLSTAYMIAGDVWNLFDDPQEELELLQRENDYCAAQAAKYPERLIPFMSLNPKRSYCRDEIDRCVDDLNLRGLKLHLWNSLVDIRDVDQRKSLKDVFTHCADRDLPVTVHAFNGGVPDYGPKDTNLLFDDIISPLENLRVCFAHLGGAGGFAPRVQEILDTMIQRAGPESDMADRVFLDMSAVLMNDPSTILKGPREARMAMARLLDRWDVQRVFWGSDNIEDYLERTLREWPLNDEDWKAVCEHDGKQFLLG